MQKIIPNLWFDSEAESAAEFYTSVFPNSKIGTKTYYGKAGKEAHGQDEGTLLTVDFEIEGYKLIALNGGPVFKFNPAISFFVHFSNVEELENMYNKLSEAGKILMALDKYDFSEKYAWIEDKFGLSWQLILSPSIEQKIIPSLLFVGEQSSKALDAIEYYTSIFPDSKIDFLDKHEDSEAEKSKIILNYGKFSLFGHQFIAMDGGLDHQFKFNEAISLLVECDDQKEIDQYWEKLSAVPEAEQCGWLKDKFGISWQIAVKDMDKKYLNDANRERADKVMTAFLAMKKLDVAEIERVYNEA